MLNRIGSAVLLLLGLYLALLADAQADMRLFGWVLAALGVLGLVFAAVLPRRRPDR